MIRPADGSTVHELLDRAARVPERYRRIVVSAPFLDGTGRELLNRVRRSCPGCDRRLTLAVPAERDRREFLGDELSDGAVQVRSVPRLHAKVYALFGIDPWDTEAVITSANLTASGLFRNREIGVHLRGCDEHARRVIDRVAARAHN